MKAVLTQASKAITKTAKEKILKDNGMHNIEVSLPDHNVQSNSSIITGIALPLGFQILRSIQSIFI